MRKVRGFLPSAVAVVPVVFAVVFLCRSTVQAAGLSNSIGMEFVKVAPGSFYMGSERSRRSRAAADECPRHKVDIAYPFLIGKYEVTLGQFRRFIDAAGRNDLLTVDFLRYNNRGDDVPVCMVSWHDARAFIRWLNGREKRNYRLPTEAEWEYAARAGSESLYGHGDTEDLLSEYAWYKENSGGRPHRVGTKKPNRWGIYGMQGNVREWCEDCWHKNYENAPVDGSAWENSANRSGQGSNGNATDYRVARGGCWFYGVWGLRPAARGGSIASFRGVNRGFRLVLPLAAKEQKK